MFTPANTYICVRSPKSINLFINEHFIRQIELPDEKEIDPYINFKIIASSNFLEENKFIIILSIKRDLSSYFIKIVNISQVFPLYIKLNEVFFLFRFGKILNKDVLIPMNEEIKKKISHNRPSTVCDFEIKLFSTKEQINAMINFMESNDNEKFNIGNILLWEDNYLIVGTPFNYLDIIDYKNKVKVGVINNTESMRSIYNNKDEEVNDIITYNISEIIKDPQYGLSFIMRDNKGKIQYIKFLFN